MDEEEREILCNLASNVHEVAAMVRAQGLEEAPRQQHLSAIANELGGIREVLESLCYTLKRIDVLLSEKGV